MTAIVQGNQLRAMGLGIKVDRAAATLPQTATQTIFTVSGGRVVVTSILGEVTVVLGAVGNLNLVHDPTGAAAVGDLCAATACGTDEVGTLYHITGVAADLLSAQKVTGVEVPTPVFALTPQVGGIILPAGALGLKSSASSTGSIKWTLTYFPLDDGASVAAA